MSGKQPYKRSWKNLLINKDYQLKMTLVLVGVSALLMAGLGWWVMSQARTATEVAINNVEGTRCEAPPWLQDEPSTRVVVDEITDIKPKSPDVPKSEEQTTANDAAPAAADEDEPTESDKAPTEPDKAPTEPDKAPTEPAKDGQGETTPERARGTISITDSSMEITDDEEGNVATRAAAALEEVDADERERAEQRYHDCELGKRARIIELHSGERLIFRVLVLLGALLVFGLAAYGLKMTHRVAGPLFKVTGYLRKLREGSYGEVYNLRKGDRLVDFYAHFKAAYSGVRKLQDDDIVRLKEVVTAAKSAGLGDKSPELAEALAELEQVLAEKEKSIG